jgi:hypothetical protein
MRRPTKVTLLMVRKLGTIVVMVCAYKTKTLKPMPTALAPLAIATRSMIKTPAQNAVWKQFIVRKVPGFRASRRKRTIARISMSRTMTMKSMNRTTVLAMISNALDAMRYGFLRDSWLSNIFKLLEVSQCP